ncbi:ABC transporter substrate-binding protein [Aquibium carbonis]|uniref:ABC transporter substrate-binding protein n=1 Tax=Aquibium carbonis TaxID=2495581 RepID=A0A429YW82_9HYPH|nr:ABC transporter substrate-binding protein [Aquibium carbonis]RST85715.1 ABC transporter substrate-binding protein [Aquibium carbonis]
MRKTSLLLLALSVSAAALMGPAQAQDTVTVLVRNDSVGFDPHKVTGRGAAEILFMMADTLVAVEDDQKTLHPLLAKSWDVSEDGLEYTFHIRDDASFCDGKKLTAADVAYSLNRLVDPATRSPAAWRLGSVKEIVAADDYTVRYTLNKPHNELLLHLAQSFGSIIDKDDVERLGADFGVKGLNGTGPFCWSQWMPRDNFTLTRHDAYTWGPSFYDNQGPALVDTIVWKVVPEEGAILASMQTGAGDISYVMPEWAIAQLSAAPNLTVAEPRVSNYSAYLGLRPFREMTSDTRVRQAMNLAVDREALAASMWFGQANPATTLVSPRTIDYSGEYQASYDPDKARALLDEAGWELSSDGFRYKDGKRLTPSILAAGTSGWRSRLEAIQGYMKEVGIDLQLQLVEPAAAMAQINTSNEFDGYALFSPYATAGEVLMMFHSANIPAPNRFHWKSDETDAQLEAGQTALVDADKSTAYAAVQKTVAEEALLIPLVHEKLFLFTTDRVKNVRVHGIYNSALYKGLDIEVAK